MRSAPSRSASSSRSRPTAWRYEDLFQGRAVLPPELGEDVEPFDDGREPRRVGLEPLELAGGRRRHVGDAFDELVGDREARGGLRIHLGEGHERPAQRRQGRQRAPVVRLERRDGVRKEPTSLLDARERHLLPSEDFLLARDRAGTVDLADPELQHLEPRGAILAERGDPLPVRVLLLPGRVQAPDLCSPLRQRSEPVEKLARGGGVEELARLRLPVEDEEPRRELGQRAEGGRRAVDEQAPLPARRDLAPHDDLGRAAHARLPETRCGKRFRDGRIVELERPLDDEAFGPAPYEGGVGPLAREEREGVDDERLPRAGLSRQDRQAGVERDVDVLEDGEVPDSEG